MSAQRAPKVSNSPQTLFFHRLCMSVFVYSYINKSVPCHVAKRYTMTISRDWFIRGFPTIKYVYCRPQRQDGIWVGIGMEFKEKMVSLISGRQIKTEISLLVFKSWTLQYSINCRLCPSRILHYIHIMRSKRKSHLFEESIC